MKSVLALLKLDCCQKSPGFPIGVRVRRPRGWANGDTVLRPPRAQAARRGRLNDGSALGVSGTVGQVASTRRAPLTLDAQGHPGVQVSPREEASVPRVHLRGHAGLMRRAGSAGTDREGRRDHPAHSAGLVPLCLQLRASPPEQVLLLQVQRTRFRFEFSMVRDGAAVPAPRLQFNRNKG
jgi:hypothetical protein